MRNKKSLTDYEKFQLLKSGKKVMKQPKIDLTFKRLHEINVSRCKKDPLNQWTPLEWGGDMAGEAGELCNLLKKLRRGDKINKKDIAHEMADIITYVDLIAERMNIDLEAAIIEKFNIVSKRWKSKYML